jgi:predicted DNA-binding transcriptional regulator YafY
MTAISPAPLRFTYTNWRGETSVRSVWPIRVEWGSNEYHPEPQWLLVALDLERDAERTFAIKDIHEFHPSVSE